MLATFAQRQAKDEHHWVWMSWCSLCWTSCRWRCDLSLSRSAHLRIRLHIFHASLTAVFLPSHQPLYNWIRIILVLRLPALFSMFRFRLCCDLQNREEKKTAFLIRLTDSNMLSLSCNCPFWPRWRHRTSKHNTHTQVTDREESTLTLAERRERTEIRKCFLHEEQQRLNNNPTYRIWKLHTPAAVPPVYQSLFAQN